MPSNDNSRTCICKHINHFRHLLAHFETFWDALRHFETFWNILRHFETFWDILSNFEQAGAILSIFFGPAWVISSNFEHFCRASWSCRAILNIFFETRHGIVDLGQCWKCLNWGCFEASCWKRWLIVNPTDLDPKTRSVNIMGIRWEYLYTWDSTDHSTNWVRGLDHLVHPGMKISQWMKLPYPTELTGVMLPTIRGMNHQVTLGKTCCFTEKPWENHLSHHNDQKLS